MDNGLVELIAVPRFNRILSLRLKPDGENLLWNSMEEVFAGWRNYGGSKLLPAPPASAAASPEASSGAAERMAERLVAAASGVGSASRHP